MAMESPVLEKALCCQLCCDLYVDPVLLSCRHSFCKECLEEYRETRKSLKCPLCKKQSPKGLLPPNLQLKILCDNFRQERNNSAARSETLCKLHAEKLKLFCLEDKEPVCIVCKDSKGHTNHNFRPLNEAATEHREELRSKLNPLQEKLNLFLKAKQICDQTAQHIKSQAVNTEKRIKEEFEKLHQFLREEEKNSLSALKEEAEAKRQMSKDTCNSINHEILHLSNTITSTHQELATEDISFLKNYKATLKRTQCQLKDPEIPSNALIDVAKHLGNLKFRMWEKMKDIVTYTPVILDSNTAHHCLSITDDLTSFVCKDKSQNCPENPERFDHHLWVLGSEGFNSGAHCWDVEVENCQQWALGVVTGFKIYGGIWKCNYQNILYGASSSGCPTIPLRVRENLKKIRVQLDWDGGQVLFSNPISGQHLYTFSYKFTELVFPYFCNQCKLHALSILPKEPLIDIRQPKYNTNELMYLATDSTV